MIDRAEFKIVLDTNVLVIGLISRGTPPQILFDMWLSGVFQVVISLELLDELLHVLEYPRIKQRLNLESSEIDRIIQLLLSRAELVTGKLKLPGVTRDPKDDRVVACAVEGGADYIVSGDKDLLDLESYQGIKILTPRQFIRGLDKDQG